MGIPNFLKHLPHAADYKYGIHSFRPGEKTVVWDAAGCLWNLAYRNQADYLRKDYTAAVNGFHRQLLMFVKMKRWSMIVIFDGFDPPEKEPERRRRQQRAEQSTNPSASIRNDPVYISLCAKVCRDLFVQYIVSPLEADMQATYEAISHGNAIVMTGDGDLVAYGCKQVLMVTSWTPSSEEYRFFDLNLVEESEEVVFSVVFKAYKKFGTEVFHVCAALLGCDVTEQESGLPDYGEVALESALEAFTNASETWDLDLFAETLRPRQGRAGLPVAQIKTYLRYVSNWFKGKHATCYSKVDGILQRISLFDGSALEPPQCLRDPSTMNRHFAGLVNPRTGQSFTAEEWKLLTAYETHNALHNSITAREEVFPDVNDLDGPRLKEELRAWGGSLTNPETQKAWTNPDMRRLLRRYHFMAKEQPHLRNKYNRTLQGNGLWTKIESGHKMPVSATLHGLIEAPELIQQRVWFEKALSYLQDGKFIDDYDQIARVAPVLSENIIQLNFAHIGLSSSQKNLRTSLQRALETEHLVYHAIADVTDDTSNTRLLYVLSKQEASVHRDEETRKDTPMGEKPKRDLYLTLTVFNVEKAPNHGLGTITSIVFAYCGARCPAGLCGRCIHIAQSSWVQFHIWDDCRPCERPPTMDLCTWIRRGATQDVSVTDPASMLLIRKLPGSMAEAKVRMKRGSARNVNEGRSAEYDVWNGDPRKRQQLNDPALFSKARTEALFSQLREDEKLCRCKNKDWEEEAAKLE